MTSATRLLEFCSLKSALSVAEPPDPAIDLDPNGPVASFIEVTQECAATAPVPFLGSLSNGMARADRQTNLPHTVTCKHLFFDSESRMAPSPRVFCLEDTENPEEQVYHQTSALASAIMLPQHCRSVCAETSNACAVAGSTITWHALDGLDCKTGVEMAANWRHMQNMQVALQGCTTFSRFRESRICKSNEQRTVTHLDIFTF